MSGDNYDAQLLDAFRLPEPIRDEACAARCREIYAEYPVPTHAGLADSIIAATMFRRDREDRIGVARLTLLVALDQIEREAATATQALDDLDRECDLTIISPQRMGQGIGFTRINQALDAVKLAVAAAKQQAPDLDKAEED